LCVGAGSSAAVSWKRTTFVFFFFTSAQCSASNWKRCKIHPFLFCVNKGSPADMHFLFVALMEHGTRIKHGFLIIGDDAQYRKFHGGGVRCAKKNVLKGRGRLRYHFVM
jgi:hypothetical protein